MVVIFKNNIYILNNYAHLTWEWAHGAPPATIPEVVLLKFVTFETEASIKVGRKTAND